MARFYLLPQANHRLDEIYTHTRTTWGTEQADTYISELFERFEAIVTNRVIWRPIPAEFEVHGYFCRYRHHVIYWRTLGTDDIAIVTILHERMHQLTRFKEALDEDDGSA